MKRVSGWMYIVMFVLCLLMIPISASADVTLPSNLTMIEEDAFLNNTALTGALVIPEGVTAIGDRAFSGCTGLTSVVLPESVTTIGSKAFSGCTGLTGEIVIGSDVTVAEDAFSGCDDVTVKVEKPATPAEYFTYTIENEEVTITGFDADCGVADVVVPERIEGYPVTALAEKVFHNIDSVTSVVIPDSVSSVGAWMFYSCAKLQSVTLPANLTSINNYLCSYCDQLESINIPDGVTSIGDMAFYSCYNLYSITIPASVTSISSEALGGRGSRITVYGDAGSYAQTYAAERGFIDFVVINCFSYTIKNGEVIITAFNPDSGITDVIVPPKMANLPVVCIDSDAFKNCTAVTNVTLPAGLESIGSGAFSGCTGLTEFALPGTVTSIGSGAFSGCTGLNGIAVPDSVIGIGDNAFDGCPDSLVIYGKAGSCAETYAEENGITFSGETHASYFSYEIENGEVTITGFDKESDLTEVVVPAKIEGYPVTTIREFTFDNSDLVSVVLPESLKNVKSYAFAYCESLSYVSIPRSLTTLEPQVFDGCAVLSTLDIAADHPVYAIVNGIVYNKNTKTVVTCIYGQGAVSTVINVPEGIEVIGSCAFRYLDWMTEVNLPSTLKRIEIMAFNFEETTCNVTTLTIPESVEYIGGWAFCRWPALTQLSVSEDIAHIDESAFAGCTGLTGTLHFSSKACIHANAFYGCDNLTITVETVEGEAPANHFKYEAKDGAVTITGYKYPMGVTSVIVPAEIDGLPVTKIGDEAFAYNGTLTGITLPDSIIDIGDYAFTSCSVLTSMEIPEGVKSIGKRALGSCSALTSVTLPSTLTTVGSGLLSGSPATALTLAEDHAVLGYRNGMLYTKADMRLNSAVVAAEITHLYIPEFIRTVGSYAINASKLREVEFAEGVEKLEAYAVTNGYNLYTVTVPSTLMKLEEYALAYLYNLRNNIMLPYGAEVADTAFQDAASTITYAPAPTEDTPAKYFSYTTNDEGITITGYSGPAVITGVRIPATISGQKVTAIGGGYLFFDEPTVKTIYVPEGVTTLGADSLRESRGLENIYLPSTLTSIGDNCFVWCDHLKSISIPDSVTTLGTNMFSSCESLTYCKLPSGLKTLPTWTFGNCYALEEVVMPTALEEIETWAFYNCGPIKSLVLPDTVTKLAEQAFYCCGAQSITLSKGLTELPKQAMQYCDGLTSLVIPEGVKTLGEEALGTCMSLESLSLPSTLTSIGANALGGCDSLTSVTISEQNEYFKVSNGALLDAKTGEMLLLLTGIAEDGSYTVGSDVKRIGSKAFWGRGTLKSVVIPEGVTSIGSQAFGTCVKLASVTIPASVTEIEEGAFDACEVLTDIIIAEGNEHYSVTGNALVSADKTLIFPIGAKTAASYAVPEGVVRIGDYAFDWANKLTEVSLPSTLTSIGDYAFNSCGSLTEIELPDGLVSIGDYAFCNNVSLKAIILPDTVTSLGVSAFAFCNDAETLKLSAALASIPDYAFNGAGVTEVILPASMRTLGEYCFGYCESLTKMVLNEGLTTIGFGSIAYCPGLTEITVPQSVTTIGDWAFGVTQDNLTMTVNMGSAAEEYCKMNNVKHVYSSDDYTDASCFTYTVVDNTSVTITGYDNSAAVVIMPEKIEGLPIVAIADRAFENSTITGIAFASGIQSIGAYAFSGCSALVDCTLPDNLLSIGDYAFKGCTAFKNGILHIPGSVTSIGELIAEKSIMLSIVPGSAGESYAEENRYNYGC